MKLQLLKTCTLLSFTAGAAGAAAAAEDNAPWSLAVIGGNTSSMTGSLALSGQSTIPNLDALDPTLAGNGVATLGRLRYDDIFEPSYAAGLELDHAVSGHWLIDARLLYESLSGRTLPFGHVSGGALESPATLAARFADTDNMSLEIGTRYEWANSSRWRPFVGAGLGVTRLDGIRGELAATGLSLADPSVAFTRTHHVFSQDLETGADLDLGRSFGVRFSVGADHFGTSRRVPDPTLEALGSDVNGNAEARWAFPLAVNAVFKFQ